MKICVVGLRGIPGILGGIESHCEELFPRLAARIPAADITVCGRKPYTGPDERMIKGVRMVPFATTKGKFSETVIATWHALWYAYRQKTDVVHIHAVGPALLTPLARLLGMKVIFTHHGADYERAKWGSFAKNVLRLGEYLGVRFADTVICVSPSLQKGLQRRYPGWTARFVYLPNGATDLPRTSVTDQSLIDKFGVRPGNFLLAVARLVPEKGLSYLVEAHARAHNPPPLIVAGSEMHGSGYADRLKAAAGPGVLFIGAQDKVTLGALYRNTALFVMPSFHEGLPIAALEAMGAGARMLLSDIPANVDLGLAPGNYFPVGDVEALARRLSGDFARFAISSESTKAFDWDIIADKTLEVYREVVV